MGGKSAPSPPDYGPLVQASREAAEIAAGVGMEQLEWAREQYAQNRELLDDVLAVQLPIAVEQWENSVADRKRYEEKFQPIEDALIDEFTNYASEERVSREAGRSMADVARAQDAQRENALQRLEGYGIDPSQTRHQALDANLRAQEAASIAGAGNQSRQQTENIGRALRSEAINIGKGMPSQVAQSYGQAIQAPASAMSGANQTFNTGANAMGNPAQWQGLAQSGYGQSANIMGQGYRDQLSGWQAGQNASAAAWSGIGSLAGMAMGGGFGTAMGNSLFKVAEGGAIEGPGGPKDDAIPARLSDGEYVIPAEVVRRKGTEFFDKLLTKAREDIAAREASSAHQSPAGPMMALQPPAHYAEGGEVSQQGRMGWQQAIPPVAGPANSPSPAPAPQMQQGPSQQQMQQAAQRNAAMQAVADKYRNRATQPRPAPPVANARLEGESLRDYFRRKYAIGEQPEAPTGPVQREDGTYEQPKGAIPFNSLGPDPSYWDQNTGRWVSPNSFGSGGD